MYKRQAGTYKNKGYSIGKVETGSVEEHYLDLLYDPDVYKRQAGVRLICSFTYDIYRLAEMIGNQCELKVPVSYTHLDVYKRQG